MNTSTSASNNTSVVCSLLGNSSASEFYMPTFRNLPTTCFVDGPTLNPVTLLPIGLGYFQAKPSPACIPQLFSNLVIIHLLAHEDGTECSETSAYKIETPGNCTEENIQHTEHGESLKSRIISLLLN
jgi:hypothetical protein